MPISTFYHAVLAFAEGNYAKAARLAAAAAALDPSQPVYPAAATYLDRIALEGKTNVYISGEAFAAFIRGGGNRGLYQATSAALQATYQTYAVQTLLDVGVGDGMALLPALSPSLRMIDLVEPAATMLSHTSTALAAQGVAHRSFLGTVQAFAKTEAKSRHWDLAQATYSLQALPPAERRSTLAWLRGVADRLVIAEFDVPALFEEPGTLQSVAYVLERYRSGLAEYADDSRVVQGFLMPVMFGYFDPDATRTTYEQPLSAWRDELSEAGFAMIKSEPLYAYWWADAALLVAE